MTDRTIESHSEIPPLANHPAPEQPELTEQKRTIGRTETGTVWPPRFTLADAERAYDEWGANCGPGAFAAVMGLTLDEIRPHMGDFEQKHYTNPTLMFSALDSIGADYRRKATFSGKTEFDWPQYGLARIQWEGPWTKPGVPMAARYRHTHWVGAGQHKGDIGVFDINCINNGSGWVLLRDWREIVVPHILEECVPRADGKWHITHAIEIAPRRSQ